MRVSLRRNTPADGAGVASTPAEKPTLAERWRAARLYRAQARFDDAIAECATIADAHDQTWSPIALVEAARIEIGPRAAPERAIVLVDRFDASGPRTRWPPRPTSCVVARCASSAAAPSAARPMRVRTSDHSRKSRFLGSTGRFRLAVAGTSAPNLLDIDVSDPRSARAIEQNGNQNQRGLLFDVQDNLRRVHPAVPVTGSDVATTSSRLFSSISIQSRVDPVRPSDLIQADKRRRHPL